MRYDFDLVNVICSEQGFPVVEGKDRLEIGLGKDSVLCFQNDESDEDCLIGFRGTPWHTHGRFIFSDTRSYLEMSYLEVLTGLDDGSVLVCTLVDAGAVKDRWLIHRDYNNEYNHLQVGEQIVVFRAARAGPN